MLTSYLKRSTMSQSRCQAVQPLETRLLNLQSKGRRVSVFVGPIVPPFFFSDKPLQKAEGIPALFVTLPTKEPIRLTVESIIPTTSPARTPQVLVRLQNCGLTQNQCIIRQR